MTKFPSSEEAAQVRVTRNRPEHPLEQPPGKLVVGKHGDGKVESSLRQIKR